MSNIEPASKQDMVTVYTHFSKLLDEREKQHDMRIAALEKATEIAARSMERRLDSMNEFREALREQANRMATKDEVSAAMMGVERDLRQLRDFKVMLEAKASQQQVNVALALSILGLGLSVILRLAQ